jgi:FMN-dependent NADH-azoreductase
MEKLLFIDSCIRGELSNTRKIALPLIEKLKEKYEVTTLTINDLKLDIVQEQLIAERQKGNVPEYVVEWANLIKSCDRLVIAAPFWDMSFPSSLKVFIELSSLFNVTFAVNDKTCYGLCKCKKTLYITTRGMNIPTRDKLDGATPYLECLSHLWGLGPIEVLSAYNMDFVSEEEKQNKVNNAIKEGLELIKDF